MTAVLERPTLVLNRNWQPVGVASVARTLVKVWNDHAVIVDPADYETYSWDDWTALAPAEGEKVIRTQKLELRVSRSGDHDTVRQGSKLCGHFQSSESV